MGERVTIGQSVGLMMVGVFALGIFVIVKDCMGSTWKALGLILGCIAVAAWVVIGVGLITGWE